VKIPCAELQANRVKREKRKDGCAPAEKGKPARARAQELGRTNINPDCVGVRALEPAKKGGGGTS